MRKSLIAAAIVLLLAPQVWAGMSTITLSEFGTNRLIGISVVLFLLIIVTATILTYCWNRLVKDSTLPRLTHPKAIGFAFLGGLLFFLVLVMIAGSRELLSPGEWRPNGILYKLNTPPEPPVLSAGFDPDTLIPLEDSPEARLAVRRENLIRLRSALWKYADENGGNFPDAIPQTLHVIPVSGGVKYRYAPHDGAFLVLEPDLNEPPRLGLNRQGVIVEYQDQSNNTEGQ